MRLTWGLAVVVWAACGGGSSGTGADGGGGGGSASVGVDLSIGSASAATLLGGLAAGSGDEFVVVSITLANSGAKVPLSTNPVLFSLATSESLVYAPTGAQSDTPCGPTVSVGSGGHKDCSIVFQIPLGHAPTTLAYNDLQGDTASVAVPTIAAPVGPSAACMTLEGYEQSSNSACFPCLQAATSSGGACQLAASNYMSGCTQCAQCNSGGTDVCTCEFDCDTTACQQKFDTFDQCLVTQCGSDCR